MTSLHDTMQDTLQRIGAIGRTGSGAQASGAFKPTHVGLPALRHSSSSHHHHSYAPPQALSQVTGTAFANPYNDFHKLDTHVASVAGGADSDSHIISASQVGRPTSVTGPAGGRSSNAGKKKVLIIGVIILGVLLAVALGVYIFLYRKNKKKQQEDDARVLEMQQQAEQRLRAANVAAADTETAPHTPQRGGSGSGRPTIVDETASPVRPVTPPMATATAAVPVAQPPRPQQQQQQQQPVAVPHQPQQQQQAGSRGTVVEAGSTGIFQNLESVVAEQMRLQQNQQPAQPQPQPQTPAFQPPQQPSQAQLPQQLSQAPTFLSQAQPLAQAQPAQPPQPPQQPQQPRQVPPSDDSAKVLNYLDTAITDVTRNIIATRFAQETIAADRAFGTQQTQHDEAVLSNQGEPAHMTTSAQPILLPSTLLDEPMAKHPLDAQPVSDVRPATA